MNYDIILMDADETLFDFEQAEAHAFRHAMEEFHLPYHEEDRLLYRTVNQSLWDALERGETTQDALKVERFRLLFEQLGFTVDCEAFNHTFLNALSDGYFTIDGAAQLCKTLHEAGCKLYIATNGIGTTQRKRLAHSDIHSYISDLFISEELGFHKPRAEFFDALFAKLEITDRSRAILLGDSLTSDMQGGKNAGISTCWFNPRRTPCPKPQLCDSEIHTLTQFIAIVTG
ncbi:YjjG family noncanonical pyrimidine nucleotidase [Hydrogenoanaerobacterium sp.]|uniref:YjjG family noncanonical pyrimidine nucleotidase n=1 Tax=Hydrogenoanaerobacterium sp. TaxID=2953763 RepID=UPI00289E7AAD|nr:YjjG family noncanonical pyrimidine nucleotidase [Hydrogenoanaerobacterium sp.]